MNLFPLKNAEFFIIYWTKISNGCSSFKTYQKLNQKFVSSQILKLLLKLTGLGGDVIGKGYSQTVPCLSPIATAFPECETETQEASGNGTRLWLTQWNDAHLIFLIRSSSDGISSPDGTAQIMKEPLSSEARANLNLISKLFGEVKFYNTAGFSDPLIDRKFDRNLEFEKSFKNFT
jgi:hypothetical protein